MTEPDLGAKSDFCDSSVTAERENRPLSSYLHRCKRKAGHTAEKHECICGATWTDKKDKVEL